MQERSEFSTRKDEQNKRDQVKKSIFDPASFGLFVIRPKHSRFRESFFTMPFQKRLSTLEKYITAADMHYCKSPEKNSGLIVGSEYLFRKYHKKESKQYYSERKKERYVSMLTELSKHTNLIIAPGTICWHGVNQQQERHYHNEIYFFYKGKVKQYNKSYPHPIDLKYINKKNYKTGDNPVIKLNGISIGVEICLDNAYKHLNSKIYPNPYVTKSEAQSPEKIDVHLLVADGIKKPNLIAQSELLFFKVERTSKYKTEIGTIDTESSRETKLQKASPIALSKDLYSYEFNDPVNTVS